MLTTVLMIILGALLLAAGTLAHLVLSSPAGQMFGAVFNGWADNCRHGPELGRDG